MPALEKKTAVRERSQRIAPISRSATKRLLKRLAGGPLPLSALSAGAAVEGGQSASGAGSLSKDVDALLHTDLAVLGADGALRLSTAGRAWLKRAMVESEGYQEQHQHRTARTIVDRSGVAASVTVNLKESPLAWLHFRKGRNGKALLDARQFEAGERLRRDYEFGQIRPGMTTQSWNPVAGGSRDGIKDLSDAAMDARARVESALAAVGPELSGVLVDVCCYLKGLELVESERRWPARSAKLVLGLSLDRLARHYGLA